MDTQESRVTTTSSADIAIAATGISKRFGGALAVDDVSLRIAPGEIHSIVGENGAGKSTLMRVMAGIIESDSGSVEVFGTPVDPGTRAAINAGIALVHQELSLVPEMTVAENILLGAFPTRFGFTRYKDLKEIAANALAEIGVSVDL
ncbi:MAG: ATP-binding cassette domain-containing protein, partial [Actinomycetota bacterium]|nr:ATP-binding cassette domain-containing protein [Actinomycetota bacterium]